MKNPVRPLILMLFLLACYQSVLAQPAINIAPAGQQSVLFWADNPTNYMLLSTTNLASSNWIPASDAVPVAAVTVSNTSVARFFRLTNAPAGMALVPAGSFVIGDVSGDSVPLTFLHTNVYVSAFYMDVNLVNSNQWRTVQSYATNHGYGFVNAGASKGANYPVERVDWYDCVKWSNARSQQTGLTPVYYTDAGLTQVYTNGEVTPYVNWTASGYRLPTSAEWEKAARGGLSGRRFPWGNVISQSVANYKGSTTDGLHDDAGPNGFNAAFSGAFPYTSPVGTFEPNGYGLYDMAGNVEEWCWDWDSVWIPPYATGSPYLGGTDPHGSASPYLSVPYRVLRSGGWRLEGYQQQCAFEDAFEPGSVVPITVNSVGFRCVRVALVF